MHMYFKVYFTFGKFRCNVEVQTPTVRCLHAFENKNSLKWALEEEKISTINISDQLVKHCQAVTPSPFPAEED